MEQGQNYLKAYAARLLAEHTGDSSLLSEYDYLLTQSDSDGVLANPLTDVQTYAMVSA